MRQRLLWLPCCLALFGCGLDFTAKQLDEPCTRTAQCTNSLVCLAGVCQPSTDAGVDAGADAGQ